LDLLTAAGIDAILLSLRVSLWAVVASLPLGIAVAWLLAMGALIAFEAPARAIRRRGGHDGARKRNGRACADRRGCLRRYPILMPTKGFLRIFFRLLGCRSAIL